MCVLKYSSLKLKLVERYCNHIVVIYDCGSKTGYGFFRGDPYLWIVPDQLRFRTDGGMDRLWVWNLGRDLKIFSRNYNYSIILWSYYGNSTLSCWSAFEICNHWSTDVVSTARQQPGKVKSTPIPGTYGDMMVICNRMILPTRMPNVRKHGTAHSCLQVSKILHGHPNWGRNMIHEVQSHPMAFLVCVHAL